MELLQPFENGWRLNYRGAIIENKRGYAALRVNCLIGKTVVLATVSDEMHRLNAVFEALQVEPNPSVIRSA